MTNLTKIASQIFAYSYLIITLLINVLPYAGDQRQLMDFGSFYASGLKAQNGENPYDSNSAFIFDIVFQRVGAGGKMMNLNPPISVVFFSLLARFDPFKAMRVWQILSAFFYIAVVFALAGTYKQYLTPARFVWAFTLAGFWHTISLGQIYVAILVFTTAAWILLKNDRRVLAGIAIGMALTLKPNFVVWPIFLLFSGYFSVFVAAALSAIAISLIPIALYGPKIYIQWLEASAVPHATLIMPGNNSFAGLVSRFNYDSLGVALSISLLLALLYLSIRQGKDSPQRFERVSALGILASLLASPIAWTGYTILLLPVFFHKKDWAPLRVAAAIILSVPFAVVLQLWQNSFVNFVIFGWLYGWALLCLLVEFGANTKTMSASRAI